MSLAVVALSISVLNACQASEIKVTPSSVCSGANVEVAWSDISNPGDEDYIGAWQPTNSTGIYIAYERANKRQTSGSVVFTNLSIDYTKGPIEFRYCRNDDCSDQKPANLAATSSDVPIADGCMRPIRPEMGAPEQISLTLTGRPGEMAVTWTVFDIPTSSMGSVQYGTDRMTLNMTASSLSEPFDDNGACQQRNIHVGVMTGLESERTYFYRVRDEHGPWSDLYKFTSIDYQTGSFDFVIFGDMQLKPDKPQDTSINQINKALDQGALFVIHDGDIAYNLDSKSCKQGDAWGNAIQELATRVPYMYAPGNHEYDGGLWSNYRARYRALNITGQHSGSGQSRYYSFEVGLVHFIAFDCDAYVYDEAAFMLADQYLFIANDLARVNRSRTPWIVLFGHYPMYCSTDNTTSHEVVTEDIKPPPHYGWGFDAKGVEAPGWNKDCTQTALSMREGLVDKMTGQSKWGLEALLAQHGVEWYFGSHDHDYERTWPVLREYLPSGSSYTNPKATVHITTGVAGSPGFDGLGSAGPFDAFRQEDAYSFSYVRVYNATHMGYEQRLASNGTVVDSMILIQDNHGGPW